MTTTLWQALALMCVIEGALYALFPDGIKRAMYLLLAQPSDRLRLGGLLVAASGVATLWLIAH